MNRRESLKVLGLTAVSWKLVNLMGKQKVRVQKKVL
jgi:hypothetical protein